MRAGLHTREAHRTSRDLLLFPSKSYDTRPTMSASADTALEPSGHSYRKGVAGELTTPPTVGSWAAAAGQAGRGGMGAPCQETRYHKCLQQLMKVRMLASPARGSRASGSGTSMHTSRGPCR